MRGGSSHGYELAIGSILVSWVVTNLVYLSHWLNIFGLVEFLVCTGDWVVASLSGPNFTVAFLSELLSPSILFCKDLLGPFPRCVGPPACVVSTAQSGAAPKKLPLSELSHCGRPCGGSALQLPSAQAALEPLPPSLLWSS